MVQGFSGLIGQSWESLCSRQHKVPSEDLGLSSARPQPGLHLPYLSFQLQRRTDVCMALILAHFYFKYSQAGCGGSVWAT